MKRILHVVASMDPATGGVAEAIRSFIRGSEGTGVLHEVVSCDPVPFRGPDEGGLHLHALGAGRYGFAYAPALRPWLEANLPRFDAVVSHGLWLWPGVALRRTWERLGRRASSRPRLLVMPHGMLDPYFQRAPERRLKALRNLVYWSFLERRLVNAADALIFTCEEERRLARETFPSYRPRREVVVGLGVSEPPALTPAMPAAFASRCPGPIAEPWLLFLGRIHPKKGVDLLLRAYATVAAELPVPPPLVIAGPCSDPAYREELMALAARLGLSVASPSAASSAGPGVFFLDMLTGDAKWGALYGCAAFILPSHQENFGIAVVEALACDRPVLLSNRVNIWREIETDAAGWVAADTVDGITDVLRRWLSVRDSLPAGRSRHCFRTRFSLSQAARNLHDVALLPWADPR